MPAFSASEAECSHFISDVQTDADAYFALDKGRQLVGDQHQLAQFARQLRGKWRGHSVATECRGHYKSSKPHQFKYNVDASIDHTFHGAIRMDAEKAAVSNRKIVLDKVFFSPELNKQTVRKSKHYTIEFVSPTKVVFTHKYRVRSQFPGAPAHPGLVAARPQNLPEVPGPIYSDGTQDNTRSRFIHEVKEINLERDTLTVDHYLYLNGLFVSREQWELQRG